MKDVTTYWLQVDGLFMPTAIREDSSEIITHHGGVLTVWGDDTPVAEGWILPKNWDLAW